MEAYKGYSLFKDVEDKELQSRNRAVILCNIIEQNTEKNRISTRGAALALGYFDAIPEAERRSVNTKFEAMLVERGYATKASN